MDRATGVTSGRTRVVRRKIILADGASVGVDENVPQAFKHFIKQIRTRRGLKIGELADVLQVGHDLVSRWESGHREPSKDMVRVIVRRLKLTIKEQIELYDSLGYMVVVEPWEGHMVALDEYLISRVSILLANPQLPHEKRRILRDHLYKIVEDLEESIREDRF